MIRVNHDTLAAILAGRPVQIEHRSTSSFFPGQSVPVELYDPTGVRIVLTDVKIAPRRRPIVKPGDSGPKRTPRGKQTETFQITAVLDTAPPAMTLAAESGAGAAVTPLGATHDPESPEAHGYVDRAEGATALDDAGEKPDAGDVASSAISQAHKRRFAAEKVDVLAKRRAKSMGRRVQEALTQATAHGVDQEDAVTAIEEVLAQLNSEIRRAA